MASDNDNIKGFAWDSFSKTGKIGYYLFYKALSEFGGKNGTDRNRDSDKKDGIS